MSDEASTALPDTGSLLARATEGLHRCGVELKEEDGGLAARTPLTGRPLLHLAAATAGQADEAVRTARRAFTAWRAVPAPERGALVKRLGELLAAHQTELADLVTVETGKVRAEALGEVQEAMDVCDVAVGLSRQLYGRTIASGRPRHRLAEVWHPLGVVGVVSAFDLPAAFWARNTAVALVCGDTVVWKPSGRTPLTALACHALLARAAVDVGAPTGLHHVLLGGRAVGERLVGDHRVALVSAAGSVRTGRGIALRAAHRLGRCLLELGGDNAAVVTPSADLDLAARAVVLAATGTAGQHRTALRRLIVHRDVADPLLERVAHAYERLRLGDPFDPRTGVGPLATASAHRWMRAAVARALGDGGALVTGGTRHFADRAPDAHYVRPALLRMPAQTAVVREEVRAPLLYALTYRTFEEAVALNDDVPRSLSASVFTRDQREAERFLAVDGPGCRVVGVNADAAGAEVGGAFGGESGSDVWRACMRRSTATVHHCDDSPPLRRATAVPGA